MLAGMRLEGQARTHAAKRKRPRGGAPVRCVRFRPWGATRKLTVKEIALCPSATKLRIPLTPLFAPRSGSTRRTRRRSACSARPTLPPRPPHSPKPTLRWQQSRSPAGTAGGWGSNLQSRTGHTPPDAPVRPGACAPPGGWAHEARGRLPPWPGWCLRRAGTWRACWTRRAVWQCCRRPMIWNRSPNGCCR
jgi:hypothetical protein